jgi:hypothetical protein
MGRNTGWIALRGGMAGGADIILIPEHPLSIEEPCSPARAMHSSARARIASGSRRWERSNAAAIKAVARAKGRSSWRAVHRYSSHSLTASSGLPSASFGRHNIQGTEFHGLSVVSP